MMNAQKYMKRLIITFLDMRLRDENIFCYNSNLEAIDVNA